MIRSTLRSIRVSLSLLKEVIAYLISGSKLAFCDALFARITSGEVAPASRPLKLMFVILAGLRVHAYSTVIQALKAYKPEIPWDLMSRGLVRQVFEIAIIRGEPSLAREAFGNLERLHQLDMAELVSARALLGWSVHGVRHDSPFDLEMTYFKAYPAHDKWLKGTVAVETGRTAEAVSYFDECLQLASPTANELRRDVLQRLNAIRPRAMGKPE